MRDAPASQPEPRSLKRVRALRGKKVVCMLRGKMQSGRMAALPTNKAVHAVRQATPAPPQWRGGRECSAAQLSKPTLSTSSLACLRYLAISATGRVSTFSGPKLATTASSLTPARTGYS
ncbi:Uncharacterised protein [Bordetella pertussis]|nr:Uncharacterised protein [Bordetella pertussis]